MRVKLRSGKEVETRPVLPTKDSSDDDDDSWSDSELELDDIFRDGDQLEDSTPLATELGGINPMLNSVVLKNLFELCELEDLRRFRLVCKLWEEISLARWRNEMTIEIKSPWVKTMGGLLDWNQIQVLYNYDKICDKPFRKFKLRNWECPKMNEEGKLGQWDQFWRVCGPWMHSLHLSNPTVEIEEDDEEDEQKKDNGQELAKVILEMTPNLQTLKLTRMARFSLDNVPVPVQSQPNLKSLTVSLIGGAWEKPIPWRQLFRFFPNLQELECLELKEANYVNLVDAIDELRLSTSEVGGRKLDLKVNGIVAGSGLISRRRLTSLNQLIELPQLRITEMEMALRTNIVAPTFFPSVFELHGSTLKKLVLINANSDDCHDIISPPLLYLTNLAELELCFGTVQDLHFLEHVPNLRKLNLDKVNFREMMKSTDLLKMENISVENLHEFRMTMPMRKNGKTIADKLTKAEATLLAKWMPNLRSFTGELSKDGFRVVCDKWRELRELDILTTDKMGDAEVTGIEPGVGTRFPNVTDLKHLHKFKGSKLLLSEDSIWNGFLQLDYIYWLEVQLSGRVSDKAFITLFKKCPTPFLVRRDTKQKRKLNWKVATRAVKVADEFGIGWNLQADSEYPWARY